MKALLPDTMLANKVKCKACFYFSILIGQPKISLKICEMKFQSCTKKCQEKCPKIFLWRKKKIHLCTFNNGSFPLSPVTLQRKGLLWVAPKAVLDTPELMLFMSFSSISTENAQDHFWRSPGTINTLTP